MAKHHHWQRHEFAPKGTPKSSVYVNVYDESSCVCDDRIEKYFKDCTCNNMIAMTICSLGRMSSIRNGGGESKAAQACVVIFRVYKSALKKVDQLVLETKMRRNLQESTVTGYSDLRIFCKKNLPLS